MKIIRTSKQEETAVLGIIPIKVNWGEKQCGYKEITLESGFEF